jgi:hypothetical protein
MSQHGCFKAVIGHEWTATFANHIANQLHGTVWHRALQAGIIASEKSSTLSCESNI